MTKLLLAKPVVNNAVSTLNSKCLELTRQGLTPKMRVILVGDNSASRIYIRNKSKLCKEVGADFELVELSLDVDQDTFINEINKMNNDDSVTGCFVQLPVPKHLQHLDITSLINPNKDVDGFHTKNAMHIYKNDNNGFLPCTPMGIIALCKYYEIQLEGKHVVIIGRSLIVGKPLSLLLTNKNATVTLCHSKTSDITKFTKQADIIITAVGNTRFLNESYINESKNQIVIDVGINKDHNNKICGDVDFDNIKDKVSAISPVPGGVGPLTVLSLIENLVNATENILNERLK
jgi:methylenetetrahydrofolate dehydrogenase (NADP+)/methenyltetrahydrofolate cyclohydrolase